MAKLYASLIITRLSKWTKNERFRAHGQAGFRKDHRCSDHTVTLRTLIEQQRAKKDGKLYACFVEFTKVYDTIPSCMAETGKKEQE